MEKVAGIQYYSQINSTAPLSGVGSQTSMERSAMIRGHHSSISKAVEAHRDMVEQRQSRHGRRDVGAFSGTSNNDVLVTQQMARDEALSNNDTDFNTFENTLIESPSTQAKMAAIQSFQTTEPERPVIGEPVPKGSYLDIEA